MVMIDTFEANTIAMHRRLGESRISLRPHIKVHRVPALGRMQVSAGAAGIACQTLDEVETMVAAGFREILLTNSLVDSKKLRGCADSSLPGGTVAARVDESAAMTRALSEREAG